MKNIIDSKKTSQILDYHVGYVRELCENPDMREKLGASKIGKIWIFDKKKVEAYRDKIASTRRKKKKAKMLN